MFAAGSLESAFVSLFVREGSRPPSPPRIEKRDRAADAAGRGQARFPYDVRVELAMIMPAIVRVSLSC